MLLICAFAAPRTAVAGYYLLHASGSGTLTATHQTTQNWVAPADSQTNMAVSPAMTIGQKCFTGSTATASANLNVTVTGTWTPDPTLASDPAPAVVVISMTSSAFANTTTSNPDGSPGAQVAAAANDGLPVNPQDPQNPTTGVTSGVFYTVAYGGSFTVTVSAVANATAVPGPSGTNNGANYLGVGGCNVGFGTVDVATTTPSIVPTGATLDSNGNWDILVGQQFAPTVTGLPPGVAGPPAVYQWTAPGTTFQTWQPTMPAVNGNPANPNASYEVDGPGDLTLAAPSWYWNIPMGPATESVQCKVSYSPPAGQGNSFTIPMTVPVTVYLPAFTATPYPGYVRLNNKERGKNGAYWLWAGPSSDRRSFNGITWRATLKTPPTPVAFGAGRLEFVQIVTPNYSYNTIGPPPAVYVFTQNGVTGLDTYYPYAGPTNVYTENGMPWRTGDSPAMPATSAMSTVTLIGTFTVYLMYQPPNSAMWIPLANLGWNVNGTATMPMGDWSDYNSGIDPADWAGTVTCASTDFVTSNIFPNWMNIVSTSAGYVVRQ